MKNIVIIGAGSSGLSSAAYFTYQGFKVTLCDTESQAEQYKYILANDGIEIEGGSGINSKIMPEKLTSDFEASLKENDLVLICVSASRHQEISQVCAKYATPNNSFMFTPGTFGSIILKKELVKAGKDNVVGEVSGNLWACRITGDAKVVVATPLKKEIMASAYPSSDNEEFLQRFKDVLNLKEGKNVIEIALNSPNVISHLCGSILSASQIERMGKDYAYFLHGLGNNAITCFIKLEEERQRVFDKLGYSVYAPSCEGMMRNVMDYDNHEELKFFRSLSGPDSFNHRYVSEDASCGVAMLVSLAHKYGIPIPLTEAFLTIASAINNTDYFSSGYTLENLEINDTTI